MSGLAALLAGHDTPGVYTWHSAARVPDVQHAVEKAGWRFVYLDGWTIEDKESFLKATAAAVDAGDDAGASFDALADCLGQVDCGRLNGVVLLWDGWSPFARKDDASFRQGLDVLTGRTQPDRGCRFAVLLRGEGPPLDVPELPVKH
jgi:hypothetical protein